MNPRPFFLVLAASLLFVPAATAQSGPVSLAADVAPTLPPTDPIPIRFNITLDCALIATKGGTVNVDVTLSESPTWLSATASRIGFVANDCVSSAGASVKKPGTLSLRALPEAPGLTPFSIALKASVAGSSETATTRKEGVALAYRPGHVFTPSGSQTFSVTGGTFAFPLAIAVSANAATMVMFEEKTVDLGSLDGLRPMTFDVENGERNITYTIQFTPPAFNWTTAVARFRTYSHCLVGDGCTPQLEENITWTFTNEQPNSSAGAASATAAPVGSTPGPGPAVALLAAALAVAMMRCRRGPC